MFGVCKKKIFILGEQEAGKNEVINVLKGNFIGKNNTTCTVEKKHKIKTIHNDKKILLKIINTPGLENGATTLAAHRYKKYDIYCYVFDSRRFKDNNEEIKNIERIELGIKSVINEASFFINKGKDVKIKLIGTRGNYIDKNINDKIISCIQKISYEKHVPSPVKIFALENNPKNEIINFLLN